MSFVIIPDAACAMDKNLRERFHIPAYVKSKVVFPDGSEHDADLDWGEISADEYFRTMAEEKAVYKSAVMGLDHSIAVYEEFLKQGQDVLVLSLSSGLSASWSMAIKAAEELRNKYPERKIIVIDTLRYSGAIMTMIIKADELRSEGKSIEEVAEWMEQHKNNYHQMGPMDDLYFLCRTGRVNNFKAFFGTLVGVNALGDFNRNGMTDVIVKVKGKPAAIKTTVEYVKQTIVEPEKQIVVISHSYRAEKAEELRAAIEKEIAPKEIIMARVDMYCGANIGPGIAAVYYYGKPCSEGLEEEKRLMGEIVK